MAVLLDEQSVASKAVLMVQLMAEKKVHLKDSNLVGLKDAKMVVKKADLTAEKLAVWKVAC